MIVKFTKKNGAIYEIKYVKHPMVKSHEVTKFYIEDNVKGLKNSHVTYGVTVYAKTDLAEGDHVKITNIDSLVCSYYKAKKYNKYFFVADVEKASEAEVALFNKQLENPYEQ